jgi:4-hydroxythreonine-4-phosphate dehydrogenase
MRRYGFDRPRIAVAALNVHGGEGGLFGNEEQTAITPAIEEAQNLGIEVSGPFPADTIFIRAQNGEFDSIVGMYHDQINIGRKLIGILKGTTLFMGLPVPCGTTAHGTAFDKAGKGVASPASMEDTLRIVSRLSLRG